MTLAHTYRLRTKGTLLGQSVEFGVHLRHDSGPATPADVLSFWRTNTMPLVASCTSVDLSWTELTMIDTSPVGDESATLAITPAVPGVVTGDSLPPQNAVVVQLRTGQKGRRTRGRFYLPGIAETDAVAGLIGGQNLVAIEALAAGLLTQYGPAGTQGGYHLVVYSPIDLTPPPAPKWKPKETQLVTAVTQATVDHIIRTQRRRAIGVGR